jgi:hypothetical protein
MLWEFRALQIEDCLRELDQLQTTFAEELDRRKLSSIASLAFVNEFLQERSQCQRRLKTIDIINPEN